MLYDKDKIIALRLRLGISRNELARRAGIRGPSMFAIEKGEVGEIKFSTLAGIASALGVPIQDILKAPKKGTSDLSAEAMNAFGQLDENNKQAMLAAMQALAVKQKPPTRK